MINCKQDNDRAKECGGTSGLAAAAPHFDNREFDVMECNAVLMNRRCIPVVTEIPLALHVNGQNTAVLSCTGSNLRELAIGHLFTSGMISGISDIEELKINSAGWAAYCRVRNRGMAVSSGQQSLSRGDCSSGGQLDSNAGGMDQTQRCPLLSASRVHELARWIQNCSTLYESTGGNHSAALSASGNMPDCHFEDIGRHNAIDKAIGNGLLINADLAQAVLLTTSRISTEILEKIASAAIPMVIALGVPSHQAVLSAQGKGITIIGKAKGQRFIIYSCPERIATTGSVD